MALLAFVLAAGLTAVFAGAAGPTPVTTTFAFSGAMETFMVPAGVTSITVTLDGGEGGASCLMGTPSPGVPGGKGARVVATLAVSPGEQYEVRAGGMGGGFGKNGSTGCSDKGGFNGGGGPGINGNAYLIPGGGGGASDLRPAGGAALLVAGGGGGAGGYAAGPGPGGVGGPAGGAGGDSGTTGANGAPNGGVPGGCGGAAPGQSSCAIGATGSFTGGSLGTTGSAGQGGVGGTAGFQGATAVTGAAVPSAVPAGGGLARQRLHRWQRRGRRRRRLELRRARGHRRDGDSGSAVGRRPGGHRLHAAGHAGSDHDDNDANDDHDGHAADRNHPAPPAPITDPARSCCAGAARSC